MARVRVPIPDESSDEFISAKAAQLIGEDRPAKKQEQPKKTKVPKAVPYAKLLFILVLVAAVVFFAITLNDRRTLQNKVDQLSKQSNTQQSQGDEVASLEAELGKFLELPTGETPTLATVSDVDKVKGQTFFKNAQNGDKVLLYSQAGKAILYRPDTKKVIEVAQINTPAKP